MIKKILSRLVDDAVEERETAMKESMRAEIRAVTEDVCREMVSELLTSDKDEERKYYYWGVREKVETVVGTLKRGMKDKVLSELTSEEKKRAMAYVNGEEFIDTVIDRIQRKQLTRSEI